MALRCIVFDCDGVILESVSIKSLAFSRLAAPFGKTAQQRLVDYSDRNGGLSRYEKFLWFSREVLGVELQAETAKDWGTKFIQYCDDALENCPLVPGFQEVLDSWSGRLPLYVASGAPHEELNMLLERRGLARHFTAIYGSPPGKAALLQQAINHAGVSPKETIMIGDGSLDYDAAIRVGTLFYGRGKAFASSHFPWHDDLSCLNAYLETLV